MDYTTPGVSKDAHDYMKLVHVASDDDTYLEPTPAAVVACPQTVNNITYLNQTLPNKEACDKHSSDTHEYLELVDEASNDVTKREQTANNDVFGDSSEYHYPTMEETYYEITDDRTVSDKRGKSPRQPRDSLPQPPSEGGARQVKGKRKVALIAGLVTIGNAVIAAIITVIILTTSRDHNQQTGKRFQFVILLHSRFP